MSSYTLGLDLGSASIGWAIVEPHHHVVDCGVRIFDPGVNLEDFIRGREGSSNNVVRRTARLHRRQLRRKAARQRDLFELLQQTGLLPGPATRDSRSRHLVLQALDSDLRHKWRATLETAGVPEQGLVYLLRTRALDERLELSEVGRAIYHLSQRRGFKSNRREQPVESSKKAKASDDLSVVKEEIESTGKAMEAAGERSIGEHFAHQCMRGERIRRHWTDRKWFHSEFQAIWDAQANHHSALTPELRERVRALLFFQRPIASNEHLIGKCELQPAEPRAHMATLLAQRFRYMQKLNDLAIEHPLHPLPLSKEQRDCLVEALETHGDVTFDAMRKTLGFEKSVRFNLERGGEKRIPGNRTNAAMLRVIPETWGKLSPAQQDAVVEHWIGAEDDADLVGRLTADCQFTPEEARLVCSVHPEDRYFHLSSLAMSKLLPAMIDGAAFKTAEASVYGTHFAGGKVYDFLPPVQTALPSIPNPAVVRALTELRKVVNGVVRRYGKPHEVRIELARELKRNAKQRLRDSKNMRERESERKAARLLAEAHCPRPSGRDIERALLFMENERCGTCAYCESAINAQRLFGGDVDVDHILPRNRFPDDSFANKCLACRNCNQQKLGRTPFEAFGRDENRWAQILARVRSWNNNEKLARFHIADANELDVDREGSFASRRLNDTRYVSKLAVRYVGLLYGGRDVAQAGANRRVVFASTGMLTASLRRAWGLEAILREPQPAETSRVAAKPRGDHRHHAIDAIVIALSSNAVIQMASAVAAAAHYGAAERAVLKVQPPWTNFVPSIEPLVKRIVVSHRPSHKLNGPLHDETNYSAPREFSFSKGGKPARRTVTHIRKAVHLLSPKQVEDIVDPTVRLCVREKLAQVGEPAKLENDPPILKTRAGKQVPVRRVRVRTSTPVSRIGAGDRERFVASAGNHHVAIFETRDKKGEPQWESAGVVSRLDAVGRKSDRSAIIQKQLRNEESARFLFALMSGDVVELDDQRSDGRNYFVARTVSDFELTFVRHTDARKLADMAKDRGATTQASVVRALSIDKLRQWNCRKVFVDVLGKVRG